MNDSLKLYSNIARFIFDRGIRFHDIRCFATMVWAMVGLLQSKVIHLSKWSVYRKGRANAASKQRTLVRWLRNVRIKPEELYEPLARQMCRVLRGERVYLALDSSSLWDQFVMVRIALIYRGRALPLSWIVVTGESVKVAFEKYEVILDRAAHILPASCKGILLADRGFGDRKLLRKAVSLGWGFRIRLQSTIAVCHHDRKRTRIETLMPKKGQALFLQRVWLTKHWFGPLHLALGQVLTKNGFEQWAIVSDEPTSLKTFDEFGLRFDIEENFLDDKSAGFQLEASEIRNEQALYRLILILAIATFYLVNCGTHVAQMDPQRRKVDAHWRRGLSYFQIGWRWLFHALSNNLALPTNFRLLPTDDFEPVFASKNQALQSTACFFGLSLVT